MRFHSVTDPLQFHVNSSHPPPPVGYINNRFRAHNARLLCVDRHLFLRPRLVPQKRQISVTKTNHIPESRSSLGVFVISVHIEPKLYFSRQILVKIPNIKFHQNSSIGSRVVHRELTDRQTDSMSEQSHFAAAFLMFLTKKIILPRLSQRLV